MTAMAADSDQLLDEFSKDYANYFAIEFDKEKQSLDESIEELLLRLDEFVGLIDMIRSDNSQCLTHTLPDVYAKSQALETTFRKIDRLEEFVGTIRNNVVTMEDKVAEAERELNSEKSLSKVLRPLFWKKTDKDKRVKTPVYEPPDIFRTSEYFPGIDLDQNHVSDTISKVQKLSTNDDQ